MCSVAKSTIQTSFKPIFRYHGTRALLYWSLDTSCSTFFRTHVYLGQLHATLYILMSPFHYLRMWRKNFRTAIHFLWNWACMAYHKSMLLPMIRLWDRGKSYYDHRIICALSYFSENKQETYFVGRWKHYLCITIIIMDTLA